MSTKNKELGSRVKLLQDCMVKYQLDKAELANRVAAFRSYTAELVKQVSLSKSMTIVCNYFVAPWTTHMLFIRDWYIKVYLGVCLRESFQKTDANYINQLKQNNVIKYNDEDYCEGMADYPFSICSNYGLTRFLNEFKEGVHGVDVVSNLFECNDDDFADARDCLNNAIEEMRKALLKRNLVTKVSISKLEATSACCHFDLVIEQNTSGRMHWDYDSKKGKDNKAPSQYIVYSSTNKIIHTTDVYPTILSRKITKTSASSRVSSSAVVLTPAVETTTHQNERRKAKTIITSPESDGDLQLSENAATAAHHVVSDEKEYNGAFLPNNKLLAQNSDVADDAHTNRLTSDVSSPAAEVDEEKLRKRHRTSPPTGGANKTVDETTFRAQQLSLGERHEASSSMMELSRITANSENLEGGIVSQMTSLTPTIEAFAPNNNVFQISSLPTMQTPPSQKSSSIETAKALMVLNKLPVQNTGPLSLYRSSFCSSDQGSEEKQPHRDSIISSQMSPPAYSAADDNSDSRSSADGYFNDEASLVPNTFSETLVYRGPQLSQMNDEQFFKQIYGLLLDELRFGVKLESILTVFFQHRIELGLNVEVDWIAFGHVLATYAIEQFGEGETSSIGGFKKTKSSFRKGVPADQRVLMTKQQYNENNNMNRRIRAATKRIIKCIVNIWPLLVKNSDGIADICAVNLSRDTKGFWEAIRSAKEGSEESMFLTAIQQTSAETIKNISKVLDLASSNYVKLPKTLEDGMAQVRRKEEEVLSLSTPSTEGSSLEDSPSIDAADKPSVVSNGGRYTHIDDDDELVKAYSGEKKKRKLEVANDEEQQEDEGEDDTEQWERKDFANDIEDEEEDPVEEEDELPAVRQDYCNNDEINEFADEYHCKSPTYNSNSNSNSKSNLTPVDREEFFLRASEQLEEGVLDLQWGVDLFLDSVCSKPSVTSNGHIFLREEFSDCNWDTWTNAVHVARRLSEKLDIDVGTCTEPMRYKLMQAFAHTSIENDIMKKILLPLVVKYQGSDILDTPLNYGGNEDYRFIILKLFVGKEGDEEEMIESRQFKTSFSFFHTKKFQEKLKRATARKKLNGSAVFSPLSEC